MSLFKNNPNVNDTHKVGGQTYKWNGTTWKIVQSGLTGSVTTTIRTEFVATANQTTFDGLDYTPNYVDVYMNGIHLDSSDYAATDGLRVIMTSPVAVGTEIYVLAYGKFAVADTYTKAEADAKDAVLQGNINTNTTSIGNIPPATITEVSDQTNTSTGSIDIPAGTTAQRPGSANQGMLRFNTDFAKLEQFSGSDWIVIDTPPLISGANYPSGLTGLDPAGGETITIDGSNFAGCTVKFKASDGTLISAPTVTTNSPILITVVTPTLSEGDYDIVVSNDTGTGATLSPGLSVSGLPAWVSPSAGTIGTYPGNTSVSITLLAQEGSDTIAYSNTSGALPAGLSLSGSTISGTATMPSADTTSIFTMMATDDEGQTSSRSFNITVSYVHVIDNSLRFNDDDSAYLSRTPSSAGNRKTWTWSGWVKLGSHPSASQQNWTLFGENSGGQGIFIRTTPNTPKIEFSCGDGSLVTAALYRDHSAWYHIVAVYNSASSQIKMYVNGSEVTDLDTNTQPSLNNDGAINNNVAHQIGRQGTLSRYYDGYMADVNFVDGLALDPTHFGEYDSVYNQWKAKKYTGAYGTNGFYLNFGSNIAYDQSGNGNNWVANNLDLTNDFTMLDTPSNNFATLNPLYWNPIRSNTGTYSEGNLKESDITDCMVEGTIAVSSGKWYYEVMTSGDNMFGVGVPNKWGGDNPGGNNFGVAIHANGSWSGEGPGGDANGQSHGGGDVLGIAYDLINNKIWMSRNGSWSGNPSTNTNGAVFSSGTENESLVPAMRASNGSGQYTIANFGQDSSFAGNKTAQGNQDGGGVGDFYYTPPSGFLALCTENLPEPAVVPSEHFNIVTYIGSHDDNNNITGVGFQPDVVWIKARDGGGRDHLIIDSVRGPSQLLVPNTNGAEENGGNVFQSFDSDGFTVGAPGVSGGANSSLNNLVAWNWKAGGAAVTNTDGSITSNVSANPAAGFSIVSDFTEGGTVGHGLNGKPDMMIMKSRTVADDWFIYHSSVPTTPFYQFGGTGVNSGKYVNFFNSTQPDSNVFTMNSGDGQTGGNLLAYCFRSIEGYSKFGIYMGNSSADGTFIYTGFRPKYVLMKSTSGAEWIIIDSKRDEINHAASYLRVESSGEETDRSNQWNSIDILSNGFKLRSSGSGTNTADDHIFMAFAETPFKYSNAR